MNTFPLDVIELDEAYLIEADLPGVLAEQVEINVNYDHIEISVNLDIETEEKFVHRERPFRGKLSRRLSFNKPINAQLATTKLENGILSVELPLAPEAQQVTLAIN